MLAITHKNEKSCLPGPISLVAYSPPFLLLYRIPLTIKGDFAPTQLRRSARGSDQGVLRPVPAAKQYIDRFALVSLGQCCFQLFD